MPSGYSGIERAAPVDGYSTGLLCLVGGALALWLRPRAATAGGLVVGVAGWLVLLAATQLGQPAVTSGTSEQLGWGATIYLGIGVAAVGVLALAQQGLLRGRSAVVRRRASRGCSSWPEPS